MTRRVVGLFPATGLGGGLDKVHFPKFRVHQILAHGLSALGVYFTLVAYAHHYTCIVRQQLMSVRAIPYQVGGEYRSAED